MKKFWWHYQHAFILCQALKHNFFADILAMLPKTYSINASVEDSNNQKIGQFE
jgi:hypothetical protein